MKRKKLVKVHLLATAIAVLTISIFFTASLVAEIVGQESIIRTVKTGILYSLPLLISAMITLALTGKKLAGSSQHAIVIQKQRRMKIIALNGIILTIMAIFLYYQATFRSIDTIFLRAQIAELAFGFTNLIMIGLNAKAGLKLSAQKKHKA